MRRAAAAVALLMALVLSACGPSAEERFRTHDLRPLRQALEQRQSELATVLGSVHLGRKRDATAVTGAVNNVSLVAGRLAALRPPSSVAGVYARYTAANDRLVHALERFARALRGNDRTALGQASDAARSAAGAAHRADDALQAALTG